jgi:hypothetical protein
MTLPASGIAELALLEAGALTGDPEWTGWGTTAAEH